MFTLDRHHPGLAEQALVWLKGHPNTERHWALLWRLAMRTPCADDAVRACLLSLGRQWLIDWPDDVDTPKIRTVLGALPDQSLHAPTALARWLMLHKNQTAVMDEARIATLRGVLEEADPAERGWNRAWRSLSRGLNPAHATEKLGVAAFAWLTQSPPLSPAWPFIWKDFWTHWPQRRDEIRQMGRDWLRGRNFTTPGRNLVQNALFGPVARRQNKTPEA